jgi:hypothetical protein
VACGVNTLTILGIGVAKRVVKVVSIRYFQSGFQIKKILDVTLSDTPTKFCC